MNRIVSVVVGLLILFMIASSTLFVVDQRQYAVVYSLGEIKDVIAEPGLKFKLPPPLQNVVFLDRRVQTLDSSEPRAIFTAEKKSLVVDWLVKWRIVDPKQFIRNNGSQLRNLESRLSPVVNSAMNEEVTKRTVAAVLATEREKVMQDVRKRLEGTAKELGIEIVDVRVKRVDFAANITEAVYNRMKTERARAANEQRSTGAEAYRDAQKIKGEGDAKAAALYSEAFSRDPQFAQFYRSLDAYQASFKGKNDVMVLDPSSPFFNAMRNGGPGAPAAAAPKK
jgi:membrane protease subunit HflC